VPSEKVTVLQRSWAPQKHWESEGVGHENGAILCTTGSCSLHFQISRFIVHEKKKTRRGAKYLSPEMRRRAAECWHYIRFVLLTWKGKSFPRRRVQVRACSRLTRACLSPAGMEVAAFLSGKAAAISVVEKKELPFQSALGPLVGGVAMKVRKTWCKFLGRRTHAYPSSPVICNSPGNAAPALSHGPACPATSLTLGSLKEPGTHGRPRPPSRTRRAPQLSFVPKLQPRSTSRPSAGQDSRAKPGFQQPAAARDANETSLQPGAAATRCLPGFWLSAAVFTAVQPGIS